MQPMNFKTKKRMKHFYPYHILLRKALFITSHHSIYLFYLFYFSIMLCKYNIV